jgi:rubrerythrin
MLDPKFKEVIDFAINEEKKAADFYRNMMDMAKKDSSKLVLKEFVDMEIGHMKLLMNFETSGLDEYTPQVITDLQISDYMEEVDINDDLTFQEILTIAMKKEEAAKNLYMDLAAKADNDKTKNLFLKIADEEAKHKLQLETIFDDEIYVEN